MLERGRNIEHIKDYRMQPRRPGNFRTGGGRPKNEKGLSGLERDYPLNETNPLVGER